MSATLSELLHYHRKLQMSHPIIGLAAIGFMLTMWTVVMRLLLTIAKDKP